MEKVLELGRQGYRWVLDADISGFFDNLSHQAIMRELSDVVADGNILAAGGEVPQGRSDGRRQDASDATSARLKAELLRHCWPTSL